MVKTKVLKIKTGSVFINGKSYDVFSEAWQKTSKDGKTTYYEIRQPVFVSEVEPKQKEEQAPIGA